MTYIVKSGDTLWSLWKKYGGRFSWTDYQRKFRSLNPGKDPSKLYVGDVIQLPDAPAVAELGGGGGGFDGKGGGGVIPPEPWYIRLWNAIKKFFIWIVLILIAGFFFYIWLKAH